MVKLYARLVREAGMDVEAVPALWREAVRALVAQEEVAGDGG